MAAEKKEVELKGLVVRHFHMGGPEKPRVWATAEIAFKDIRKIVKIEEYDSETGKGFQRGGIEAWMKKLSGYMDRNEFTPNSWAAGVLKSHLKDLGAIEPGRKIDSWKISSTVPLVSLDGQQRWGAMEILRRKYEADPVRLKAIDESIITVTIFLDPEFTRKDFLNLQSGKAVDSSQMLSMKIREGVIDEAKQPILMLAQTTARIVNSDNTSPFHKRIKFDSGDVAPLALNSLLTLGASDIGTSIAGGAKIAIQFKKDAKWLASMYTTSFHAIEKYGEKSEVESAIDDSVHKIVNVLDKKKLLYPQGKKGSSSLLIGIGNVFAYRMAKMPRDEPRPQDLKQFVEAVEDTFNEEVNGNLSGSDKRRWMGIFLDRYTSDFTRRTADDESDKKKVDAYTNGSSFWPVDLIDILSKSAFGVPQSVTIGVGGGRSATTINVEDDDEGDDASADEGDEAEEVKPTPAIAGSKAAKTTKQQEGTLAGIMG